MCEETCTYLSLCSGVSDGRILSRSSMRMKSLPKPSYLANSIMSAAEPMILDDDDDDDDVEMVEKALAVMGRMKQKTLNSSSVMVACTRR